MTLGCFRLDISDVVILQHLEAYISNTHISIDAYGIERLYLIIGCDEGSVVNLNLVESNMEVLELDEDLCRYSESINVMYGLVNYEFFV